MTGTGIGFCGIPVGLGGGCLRMIFVSSRATLPTCRLSFAPLGRQTVIHVVMNYAPPLGGLGAMLPIEQHLESWIEQGLREFKTAMEGQEKSRVIG